MSDAQWKDIAVESLSEEAQVAYSEYKDAQRKAAQLRETFERLATEGLPVPQGMKVVFGYRFGKLSAALVVDDSKPKKAAQPKGSLADFIAAQQAGGYRA